MEPFPGHQTPEPPEEGLIDQLLLVARGIRERTDPFQPLITWQPESGGPAIMTGIDDAEPITRSFDDAFHRLRELTGPPAWFAVTLDSYAREQPAHHPKPRPDQLREAFLAGDPCIVEQMVVICMDPEDGELTMYRQVYRYTPVDGWEWNPPEHVESPDDAICTAVRMFH